MRPAPILILAAGLGLAGSTIEAASGTSELFRLAERDLIPESVAYDPVENVHYVGSMYKRKIVRIDAKGVVRDFVPSKADGMWGVLGIKVDVERRELWANVCNPTTTPPLLWPEPETVGSAAVFRYDLRTGRLKKKYPAGGPTERVCFNDLALTPGGEVYLTAGTDGIYRIQPEKDRLEVFAAPPDFANGIATSSDGRIYVALHNNGVVLLDPVTAKVRRLRVPEGGADLRGVDGLYVHGRSLVGIQNGRDPSRVVQAFLDETGERATCIAVLEEGHPIFAGIPTAGVVVGQALHYVGNSQLDAFTEGVPTPTKPLVETVILKTTLRDACPTPAPAAVAEASPRDADRAALMQIHADDRRAHFERNVDLLMSHAADELISVRDGKISRRKLEEDRAFFTKYFEGATYAVWDDLEPPILRISEDGTLAWMIVRVNVRRTQQKAGEPKAERAFVYAGITTYEKKNGRWVRTANVSSFEPVA
jgi:hypothetical protein